MGRMMTWASAVALVLVTLWILIQGYRIALRSGFIPAANPCAAASTSPFR